MNPFKRDAPSDEPMDEDPHTQNDDDADAAGETELPFMSDAIQDEADREQAALEEEAMLEDDEGLDGSDDAGEDLFASDMERYVCTNLLIFVKGIIKRMKQRIDTTLETLTIARIWTTWMPQPVNWWT